MENKGPSVTLILLIIASVIFISGIPLKVELTLEGLEYKIYCNTVGKFIEKENVNQCIDVANRLIKTQVKPISMEIVDKEAAEYVNRKLTIFNTLLLGIILIYLYPSTSGSKGSSSNTSKVKAPKIFSDVQMQKAVDNFYSIGGKLSDEEIKILREVNAGIEKLEKNNAKKEKVLAEKCASLALFMLFAQDKMNFARAEVAEGIEEPMYRKVIFSAGRPAQPPSVSIFFALAQSYIRSLKEKGHQKQGQ